LRDSSAFPIIGPEDVADLLLPPIFFLSKILAGTDQKSHMAAMHYTLFLEEREKSKKISSRSSVRVNGVRRAFLE
jgi:hypothetical protein